MFEKGKVYASGSNKSSDRVGVFQKGKVYEGGGGNLYDMSLHVVVPLCLCTEDANRA